MASFSGDFTVRGGGGGLVLGAWHNCCMGATLARTAPPSVAQLLDSPYVQTRPRELGHTRFDSVVPALAGPWRTVGVTAQSAAGATVGVAAAHEGVPCEELARRLKALGSMSSARVAKGEAGTVFVRAAAWTHDDTRGTDADWLGSDERSRHEAADRLDTFFTGPCVLFGDTGAFAHEGEGSVMHVLAHVAAHGEHGGARELGVGTTPLDGAGDVLAVRLPGGSWGSLLRALVFLSADRAAVDAVVVVGEDMPDSFATVAVGGHAVMPPVEEEVEEGEGEAAGDTPAPVESGAAVPPLTATPHARVCVRSGKVAVGMWHNVVHGVAQTPPSAEALVSGKKEWGGTVSYVPFDYCMPAQCGEWQAYTLSGDAEGENVRGFAVAHENMTRDDVRALLRKLDDVAPIFTNGPTKETVANGVGLITRYAWDYYDTRGKDSAWVADNEDALFSFFESPCCLFVDAGEADRTVLPAFRTIARCGALHGNDTAPECTSLFGVVGGADERSSALCLRVPGGEYMHGLMVLNSERTAVRCFVFHDHYVPESRCRIAVDGELVVPQAALDAWDLSAMSDRLLQEMVSDVVRNRGSTVSEEEQARVLSLDGVADNTALLASFVSAYSSLETCQLVLQHARMGAAALMMHLDAETGTSLLHRAQRAAHLEGCLAAVREYDGDATVDVNLRTCARATGISLSHARPVWSDAVLAAHEGDAELGYTPLQGAVEGVIMGRDEVVEAWLKAGADANACLLVAAALDAEGKAVRAVRASTLDLALRCVLVANERHTEEALAVVMALRGAGAQPVLFSDGAGGVRMTDDAPAFVEVRKTRNAMLSTLRDTWAKASKPAEAK